MSDSGRSRHESTKEECYESDRRDDKSNRHENGADDPEDFSDGGQGSALWIHGAIVNRFKVTMAHDPSSDAKGLAKDNAKDAEDENKSSTMRFHNFIDDQLLPGRKSIASRISMCRRNILLGRWEMVPGVVDWRLWKFFCEFCRT